MGLAETCVSERRSSTPTVSSSTVAMVSEAVRIGVPTATSPPSTALAAWGSAETAGRSTTWRSPESSRGDATNTPNTTSATAATPSAGTHDRTSGAGRTAARSRAQARCRSISLDTGTSHAAAANAAAISASVPPSSGGTASRQRTGQSKASRRGAFRFRVHTAHLDALRE
jgi:hypothetical protein